MDAPPRKAYRTDLSDAQWELIAISIPEPKPGGRPRSTDMREVINTLLYRNRTGCQWDMLPHDLLPESPVYESFAAWRDDGTWQRMLDTLREGYRAVHAKSEEPTPSVGSIDSQTVKTTEMGGERGYDGGKKTSGRKRHYAVDTLGLLLVVVVTSAAVDGRCQGGPAGAVAIGPGELSALEGDRGGQQVPQPRTQRLEGEAVGLAVGVGSGESSAGRERVRAVTQALGRGADDCLDEPGATPE